MFKKVLLVAATSLVIVATISSLLCFDNKKSAMFAYKISLDNESVNCEIRETHGGEKAFEIFCNEISVGYLNNGAKNGNCNLEDPEDVTDLQDLPPDDAVFAVSCGNTFKGYIEHNIAPKNVAFLMD